MADTAKHYEVRVRPNLGQIQSVQVQDGFCLNPILSVTNFAAIKKLIQKLMSGTDISTVVTAINAL
jgi:hypothetical protein